MGGEAPEYGTLLGVDPGNQGGIVRFDWKGGVDGGFRLIEVFQLEKGEDEIIDFLWTRVTEAMERKIGPTVAFMEKVHGWGAGRSFAFGKNYGFVRGVLRAYGIEVRDAHPPSWMKAIGVPPQQGKKAQHREAMRNLASGVVRGWGLQASVPSTNWSAAAILIGQYGVNILKGEVQ